ncbi:hypothetical protein B0H19DRAFT_1275648 [Mycena capillaripes]|nr:hypothetical protein B0H19DRAFT_1275648 [Mycena capillaripes]
MAAIDVAPLSPDACESLSRITSEKIENVHFVVQITDVTFLIGVPPFDFCIGLSDGVNTMTSALSRNLNNLVEPTASAENMVVAVTKIRWCLRPRWARRIMVIEEMHIVENRDERIGSPNRFLSS